MAFCENPKGIDEPMCGVDDDLTNEVQTLNSRNKGKT